MGCKVHVAALCAALAGMITSANANTLLGETVGVDLNVIGYTNIGKQNILVIPGPDASYVGSGFFGNFGLTVDLNAPVNGYDFTITSNNNYCGFNCTHQTLVWSLTNLNFGAPLIGFQILNDIAPVTIVSLTPTSVSFSYTDSFIPQGTFFDARFIVQGVTTPIPAALPLFATGLGGLGLLGWRRKRKAQAFA